MEDLAPIPGTRYLLAGGMRFRNPCRSGCRHGARHDGGCLATARRRPSGPGDTTPIAPDLPMHRECRPRGLALQSLTPTLSRFYAVNEGDRRAIEVFEVALAAAPGAPAAPRLGWIGCIPMPAGTNPNAVTPLDGRALAIVSMDDGAPGPHGTARGRRRPRQGLDWRPGRRPAAAARNPPARRQWHRASADNRWLYVSAWSGAQLVRIAADGRVPPQSIRPALPARQRETASGWHAAARRPAPARGAHRALHRRPSCPADWLIARFDPAIAAMDRVYEAPGSDCRELRHRCGGTRRAHLDREPRRRQDRRGRLLVLIGCSGTRAARMPTASPEWPESRRSTRARLGRSAAAPPPCGPTNEPSRPAVIDRPMPVARTRAGKVAAPVA